MGDYGMIIREGDAIDRLSSTCCMLHAVCLGNACEDNGGLPHPDAKRHFGAGLLQGLGDGPPESLRTWDWIRL